MLRPAGGELATVGAVRGLAPSERIFAARFIAERGFIVTFEQIDPLFAIDLADPRRPGVAGELKVEGFSTYLHPVGADHLLAIGNHVTNNRVDGLDLSIFDVSDLANPALAHRETVLGAYSSALHEHKAYTCFEPQRTLAIPLSDWQAPFFGLEVYDATVAGGFELRGRVSHEDLGVQVGWSAPEVTRSFIVGTTLFSISSAGVKANDVQDPKVEIGKLAVP